MFDKLKVEKLPDLRAVITGELPLDFLQKSRPKALEHLNEHVEIAGFRKGAVPESVLVKNLGEMKVLEEVAEVALGQAYGEIMRESRLSPIGQPEVAITKLAPGMPLEFKITVTLEPEFDLPDYKKVSKEVKEEDKEKRRVKIIEALIQNTKINLPKLLVEHELDRMLGQFKHDVSHMGAKWDEYLKSIKKTEEEIRTEWKEKAENRAKSELIIDKIAEAEKLEPKQEELEHEAAHLLSHHPDADPLRARIYVYQILRTQKVLEFLETL